MNKFAGITAITTTSLAIAASAIGAGVAPKTTTYAVAADAGAALTDAGVFAVEKNDQGKFRMVVDPEYTKIYYPDARKCDDSVIPLSGTEYPISRQGRFEIKDTNADVKVTWKGHWTTKTDLKGTIKISYGGCTDKRGFSGEDS